MVQHNLGKLDRIFRFVLGVWWLGPIAPQFQYEWANWLVLILGLISLIESFVGWCWLHTLFKISNKNQ